MSASERREITGQRLAWVNLRATRMHLAPGGLYKLLGRSKSVYYRVLKGKATSTPLERDLAKLLGVTLATLRSQQV